MKIKITKEKIYLFCIIILVLTILGYFGYQGYQNRIVYIYDLGYDDGLYDLAEAQTGTGNIYYIESTNLTREIKFTTIQEICEVT